MTADDFDRSVWLEPWEAFLSASRRLTFEAELRKEVGRRHALFDCRERARALAHRGDCDDALFLIEGESPYLAQVHLTWRGVPEFDPRWPSTQSFATFEEWVEKQMKPDHQAWSWTGDS